MCGAGRLPVWPPTPTMPDPAPASQPFGALAGLRVLDLSRVLAGPLCTQMLADHGASVIKVEPPAGDETRTLGPPFDAQGTAAYYLALNRGKRAIALDLGCEGGREILLRLLQTSDVLVENFLPGTMERWSLGFESVLAPRFPQLVYCAISGFGADGPLGGLPGYDAVLQAMCGLMSINGDAASGATRLGVPVVDHLTAYTALSGILMALLARQQTGRGQRVEATLFDSALSLLVPHASNWMVSGQLPGLMGSAHPNIAVYDKFRCADGEVFLGIINDGQFRRFCAHLGLDGLVRDARFATNTLRLQHRTELHATIEARLRDCPRDGLCQALMRLGVPVGPVNTVPQAFGQTHVQHRGMCVQQDGYRGVGLPVKLSHTPGQAGRLPPAYAEHSDEILAEAGFDAGARARLRASGALPPVPARPAA